MINKFLNREICIHNSPINSKLLKEIIMKALPNGGKPTGTSAAYYYVQEKRWRADGSAPKGMAVVKIKDFVMEESLTYEIY